jgi:opacity protein-like surface antigen
MTLTTTARTTIAALTLLSIVATAPAAGADPSKVSLKDQPVVIPQWEGAYFGINVGGAWGDVQTPRNIFTGIDEKPNFAPVVFFAPFFGDDHIRGSGFLGGGQFGYNFQGGSNCCFVYGIEIDLGGLDAGGKDHPFTVWRAPHDGFGGTLATVRVKNEGSGFYGDVTGRVGYIFGSALVYAKGGFAWLNTNLATHETITTVGIGNSPSSALFFGHNNDGDTTLTGWTVGAGIEYMLGTKWSVKVEYLHFDFGNVDRSCCNDPFANHFNFFRNDLTVETVKVGVNYHIQPEAIVLPYK